MESTYLYDDQKDVNMYIWGSEHVRMNIFIWIIENHLTLKYVFHVVIFRNKTLKKLLMKLFNDDFSVYKSVSKGGTPFSEQLPVWGIPKAVLASLGK